MQRKKKKAGKVSSPFSIVGIGASAGGLEAVTQLLKHLPLDTDMAYVLVQHLDPTHESALSSLLGRVTKMPVAEARNNTPLEANRLYVIPPNKSMVVAGRQLKLSPRRAGHAEYLPIDIFFHSLAASEANHAIGIVLSGNGTDGTQGLLAIKAAGGVTFAQDEASAKFHGMPNHAVTAGCVDFVLNPEQMVRELKRVTQYLATGQTLEPTGGLPPAEEKMFEDILLLLRQRTGVDFTYYKHATLRRRIRRRMVLHKLGMLKEYSSYLRSHPPEIAELFNDILIHVTGFFRDPEVFQTLRKKLFPRLLKRKPPGEPIRIWIPGCSTGEEVYSIAITLLELLQEKKLNHPVQIFATDINDLALERARAGYYPESVTSEISAGRLQQYFMKVEGGFRVSKAIRDLCIFARQNLVNDPPFSNLDLISCRNVLIYLGPTLQRKVMPVFHYALRPAGLLMLGASEAISGYADLFDLVDKKAKVYSKIPLHGRVAVSLGHTMPDPVRFKDSDLPPLMQVTPAITDVQKQADRIVLTSYSLAGVVINADFEVLQFRGRTGAFLEHAHGEATLNLLKMAREGLMPDLRTALAKTIKLNVRVRQNGHFIECHVEVIPFSVPPSAEKFYLVLFEPAFPLPPETGKEKVVKSAPAKSSQSTELAHLREELGATRESLQTIIEEQEATNEELRSANEEVMSSNEELQSTNEELETAKEELQSTNEELTTLNDELESRNTQLEQVNNDLHNLLASVNIPVVILGADLRIRRFTAMAGRFFKLIPGDIGRPITDIALPLDIPSLDKHVLDVFESLTPKDIGVQDKQGHWWSVRIRPYKTTDHKIDGAIIALLDIDTIRSRSGGGDLAEAIFTAAHEPMLVLDVNLTVKMANKRFLETFGLEPDQTIGRGIYDLAGQAWNIPRLHQLLEDLLRRDPACDGFELEHKFPGIGKKKLRINGRHLANQTATEETFLLAIQEL